MRVARKKLIAKTFVAMKKRIRKLAAKLIEDGVTVNPAWLVRPPKKIGMAKP